MSNDVAMTEYCKAVEKELQAGNTTEHSFRPALKDLIETLRPGVVATNEPKRKSGNAPDYVILKSQTPLGYIEAKDIDKDLAKLENEEQLKRYRHSLGNLMFTDYLDFRWYVGGELRRTERLATLGANNKKLKLEPDGKARVLALLEAFLDSGAPTVTSPKELAQRMAAMARFIRDETESALKGEEQNGPLHDQLDSFRQVLLPGLTREQFADMYAQTICYGLFAARVSMKGAGTFSRWNAVQFIPTTNPFLRNTFYHITGPELDERITWAVDDVAELLNRADIGAIVKDFGKRTRQEDPVVHFYETFLAEYDPKMREARGVYYTPEPVVSYIVRSVDYLLKRDFGLPDGLADYSKINVRLPDGKTVEAQHKVQILDPATGTGTFLHGVIDHIYEQTYRDSPAMWSAYVAQHLLPRLFGFELLMAPYTVAHLKLVLQLQETGYTVQGKERLNIYLTNTLEESFEEGKTLFGGHLKNEAEAAGHVKYDAPVMVVLGNPPYSGSSANKGKSITTLMERYKDAVRDEYNIGPLSDDYIKFIRFAHNRIERTGYGIIGFITNNSYVSGLVHRGMRQELIKSFDEIYILNLHGSTLMDKKTSDGGKDENVFDIRQGVALVFLVRKQGFRKNVSARILYAELLGLRKSKYDYLISNNIIGTQWKELLPQAPYFFFVPKDFDLLDESNIQTDISKIFTVFQRGVATRRDHFMVGFSQEELEKKFVTFASNLPDEVISQTLEVKSTQYWNLPQARSVVRKKKSISNEIYNYAYRPFDQRKVVYIPELIERGDSSQQVMQHMIHENKALLCFRRIRDDIATQGFVATGIVDKTLLSSKDNVTVFPLYLYPDPNKKKGMFDLDEPSDAPGGRKPNLAPEFIKAVAERLGMEFVADGKGDLRQNFGPEDVFNYMYAVFHSPTYRSRYAEFLKIDFPRLPLTSQPALFRSLVGLGEKLVGLHLMEQYGPKMVKFPVDGNSVVEQVKYTEPGQGAELGRVWINKTQYFEGVPSEVWNFHIGGYQVCEKWLKDRKGRSLSFEDMTHYPRIVSALSETMRLMSEIDQIIEEQGGWPMK